jgi:predicted transcriptional regulator
MKQEFLEFIENLMAKAGMTQDDLSDNVKAYLDILKGDTLTEKPILTDNGKLILTYLQNNPEPQKSRVIAENMGLGSRSVSGAMRKLVSDGFCEKIGQDPVVYTITEKGKKFIIE